MERKPNNLRLKLNSVGYVTGSVMYTWSPSTMEVAGHAGLDFMRIDTEHSWRRDIAVEHLIRAAYIANIIPIIRVDKDDPFIIRKALEIGAGGIIVPDIQSPEEAESVVRASKFPPRGTRGYSGQCWSAGWGSKAGPEWIEWSDSEPMIGVMIENNRVIEMLDEILAIDGLDFVLFGPADYAMSLGWRKTAKGSDEVQEAIKKTIEAATNVGKHVMLGVGVEEHEFRKYKEMGISMFEFGSDIKILSNAWEKSQAFVQNLQD
ncbi:MAG: aldolase/citrate lyase family protein [Anaerolineaceae bacterium]|nr:aldolase/citrate lyase family protein [Anaerolineaceae bacterium]